MTVSLAAGAQSLCTGQFPNLITDLCYDCLFPMTLGGGLVSFGVQGTDYDSGAGSSPICLCANSLTAGTPTSFWEPHYMVDVTNVAGCLPLMDASVISSIPNSGMGGATTNSGAVTTRSAFMHANEYLNPVMTALGVIGASPCLDSRSFDIPFMSWADPTWDDDNLSLMLTPYAYAFSGIASIAAEIPDSISATTGFPNPYLFWVAGAWGEMYPLNGHVNVASTPETTAHLLLARIFAKLHAAGTQQSTAGKSALDSCGAFGVPELIMDKRQYKTNRIFPFADNMCTPIGRPLLLQETGAARPTDKDYGYFVFQKRDCCQPIAGAAP